MCPPTVTECSCIASSRADWVLGVARLISSARTIWLKIGPGWNSNTRRPSGASITIFVPMMSAGIRSGLNWMRLKSRLSSSASVRTRSVLPRPGTPSSSACPPMNRQVRTPWTISSWPTMTLEISDFTWLYRVRNSSARASIDSEGAGDIDGDPFVTGGDFLELDNFPRPEPEFRPPPADALSCRGSRPGPRIALVLFFFAVFPDPLLGFEQAVGVAGVFRPRRVGGEAGAGAGGCSRRGSGPRPLRGLTALEQRFANGGGGSPRSRIGGRRRLEPGREAGPLELLPDLGLASAQLVQIVTAAHDLLTSQSVPSVDRRELDPVHIRGDPPNRDIAQEQAGRQPEQGRPERRERPGIDQAGITAEMVDSTERPGQVDPAIARGLPGHDLAFGEAGQGLERGRVGSKLSVLVGVRYGNARGDHALGFFMAPLTHLHEVVAAGLG